MIWAIEETMSRAEIEAKQLSRLKDTVNRVYEKVPAYRAKMEEAGVKPEHIQTLKDLQKLPFVTKQDMMDNYPYRYGRNVWPAWPWQEAPRTRMWPRFVLGNCILSPASALSTAWKRQREESILRTGWL